LRTNPNPSKILLNVRNKKKTLTAISAVTISVAIKEKSFRQTNYGTSESANDLELMSVSDDEKKSKQVPARDRDRSLIDASEIIARYQILQTDLTHNGDLADSRSSVDTSDCCTKRQQAHMNDRNNNVGDSPYATKSECFAEGTEEIKDSWKFSSPRDDISNVSSCQTERVIYDVPRLKRIGLESQLIKTRRTRQVTKSREKPGPRKIVCDMYGVRTVSYDLPEPDQVCATVGVKMSTLSESDSDKSVPPSPSRRAETTRSFESQWCDIEKNLHQPLLSDSSSTSSRSDTTTSSSSMSRGTGSSSSSSSSSSSCSCSSCSRKV